MEGEEFFDISIISFPFFFYLERARCEENIFSRKTSDVVMSDRFERRIFYIKMMNFTFDSSLEFP